MGDMFATMGSIGLVPVIRIDDASKAAKLGATLKAAGLHLVEVTMRTASAAEAMRIMTAECPGLTVGAGTVTSPELAEKAVAAGARFIVAPGFNPATIDWCQAMGIPVLPGLNNASLVEAGLAKGLKVFKFFPAEASGGLAMIDALAGPFGDIQFVPTGGIDQRNIGSYAAHRSVLAVGGSWMVKPDLIATDAWDEIAKLCSQAIAAVHGFSFFHLGINRPDEAGAQETASILERMGFPSRQTNMSIFAGTEFEVMKLPFRGAMGHIGMRCNNVERALAFLEPLGFKSVPDSVTIDKGVMQFTYLDRELGGFALHLARY